MTSLHFSMNVLYIEDNRANARLMERYFALKTEWRLELATSADEGIVAARERRPDLVLMDINLPGKSGRDALRDLRAEPGTRAIPVVAISADARPDHIEAMTAEGFDGYVTKPIDFVRLEHEILKHQP